MPEVSEQEEQKLRELKLHEQYALGNIDIMKVVGGWIYWKQLGTIKTASLGLAGVFVPEPK